MMHKPVLNILLLSVADNDAEQLTTGFRRAGQVSHEVRIDSGEQLAKQLGEHTWDLMIFDAERSALDIKQCGQLIRKHQCDLPVIYIGEGNPLSPPDATVTELLNRYDTTRLVHSALREVNALRSRRQLAELHHTLDAAEQRSKLLMDESKDAVAYITDGMIIHANRVFCDHLGHSDLDGFPIIDLVASKDQDRLKNALKQQSKGQDNRQLEMEFLRSNGQHYASAVICSNAEYEEEACIQLTLHEPGSTAQLGSQDETTSMASRKYFHQILQEFVENERNGDSSLILIAIDQFSRLRSRAGLRGSEDLVGYIANHIRQGLNAQHYGRVADDIIAAIAHHVPSGAAKELSGEIAQDVENKIFEVQKQSLQCSVSIAIMPINHLTPPHAGALMDNCFEYLEKLYREGGNKVEIYRRDRQQLDKQQSASKVISDAMADKRLQLLFEPMVNLGNASGDHYEVILDLKERTDGEITAGELLRIIEREQENNQLDRWIVMESTKILAKERLAGQDIKLIINLSGNAFHDVEFCSWLGVAIKAAGIPAASLTLQFAEESIGNNLKPALDFCKQIQQMGGAIGVRSFGRIKGADKFLSHIQPNLVKPGFRKTDTLSNEQTRELIRTAKALGSRIVIPNVASAANLAMLWQLGPDFIQGSYVHEPHPSMNYEFSAFS